MIDPDKKPVKEQDDEVDQPEHSEDTEQSNSKHSEQSDSKNTGQSNWEVSQRIDEEGNELDPDDIK